MIKFTCNNDYNFDCESVSLIKNASKDLVKRASTKDLLKFEKTPNQEDLHIIALGAYEGTGCFFEGAPVQTINGIKPIEQVKVDDLVLTGEGRYRPVLHTFESEYTGTKVELDVISMPDFISCTGNHPVKIIRAEHFKSKHRCPSLLDDGVEPIDVVDKVVADHAEFVSAENIKPGDYVLTPIAIDNESKYQEFSEDDAYLFGYYLSEGCLTKEYREDRTDYGKYVAMLFTMALNDQPCVDKLQEIIKSLNGDYVSVQKSTTSEYGLRIQFRNLTKAQQCLDLFGCQSTSKHISPLIFQQSLEWKLKFLSAYFDGDGSLVSDDTIGKARYIGSLSASTASRNLAYDLQRLLASCGITSSIYQGMNKVSNGCFGKQDNVIYQVLIGLTHSNKILQYSLRLQPVSKKPKYNTGKSWVSSKYLILKVSGVKLLHVEDTVKYNLEVAEDNTYVVDVYVHNSNRNGDAFLEKDCRKSHSQFTKSGRAVHRHHKNKPTDPKYGNIKASAYNEKMRRIELIVGLDKDKCADILHEQEKTGSTSWSMASKQAYDVCSFCGHKAKSDNDRCSHIPAQLGELNKQGEMCSMINENPNWFEISYVKRGADRLGLSLGKMASDVTYNYHSQSDYREMYGDLYIPDDLLISKKASDKRELLSKLAEMEKHIEATVKGNNKDNHSKHIRENLTKLKHSPGMSDETISSLRGMEPNMVFKALSEHGIVFSPEDFARYLFEGKVKPERVSGMKSHLPGIYSKLMDDNDGKAVNDEKYEPSSFSGLPKELSKMVKGLEEGHSLHSGPVVRRIMMITITGSGKIDKPDEKTKEASDFEFAREYAAYKLACLNHLNEQGKLDDEMILNAVLQH